jgi:general L-amino acid transport system substrate-binding protein
MGKTLLSAVLGFAALLVAGQADAGSLLDTIKARGQLVCGLGSPTAGFMQPDRQGKWAGFAVDICRGVAAAIFGDANKVKFVQLDAAKRFPALLSGEVDMLASNSTWTLTRDANGVDFTAIYYYDGQGLMVKTPGPKTVKDLNRATICFQSGTTTEANLSDYFHANSIRYTPLGLDSADQAKAAFLAGNCDALTADMSTLHALTASNPQYAKSYAVLTQTISKEPLSPVVRQGDQQFADIVRWTQFVMVEAEEDGITSRNVDQLLKSDNEKIRAILGTQPGMGKALGLGDKWAYDIIKQVGNYGESYDRNLGDSSPLKIPRSLNALWTKAGILYAPPVR